MLLAITKLNEMTRAEVFFRAGGKLVTNLWGAWREITDQEVKARLCEIRRLGYLECTTASEWFDLQHMDPERISVLAEVDYSAASATAAEDKPKKDDLKEKARVAVSKMFDFFSEFEFRPQARFVNVLANMKTSADAADYVMGYFALTNSPYAKDVAEKIKSPEWEILVRDLLGVASKKINSRFVVYYGEPGSGKTTTAIANNPDAEVVICNASMTPDELFRGFDFDDGKPVFKGCPLRRAMEQGKVVILDEINLLNEDCRRALQAITDNKETVVINTDTIQIKSGFKVIGTMNLEVGGMTFPLPEPLVDRAEEIKKFNLTPSQVADLAL